MLKPGDRLQLRIQDVAFGGKGVARHDERVVFVPFVDSGEEVVAEVTAVKKNFAEARLVEVLEASPHRVEPRCVYFQTCAGCQYQHLDYGRQLDHKSKQLRDTLERIGGIRAPIDPAIPSPEPYGYRNKLSLTWISGRLGLFAADNYTLIGVEQCPIALPEVNEKLSKLRAKKISPPKSGRNRQSFVLRTDALEKKLPEHAFAQVNDALAPKLAEIAREILRPCDTLVDAYCGAGFFALALAPRAKKIIGIELHAESIELARKEAKALGVENVEFVAAAVEKYLPEKASSLGSYAVVIDPPRTGCAPPVLETLLATKPAQILYVSCNPATLARDLKALSSAYDIERIVPVDMFPQTQHLETVCGLKLRA
ncbi:MAG: class I SAM-dependent RNA methyltransferase [Verrucomicrobiae bacterium]|nr:class I SAM-dependent RNA methyltransferase [Verrucomicrobiae bacterium]